MTIEAARLTLKKELDILTQKTMRIQKAIAALAGTEVQLVRGTRKLDPATREKIRQGALKRWANKKKAPPAGKGK